MWYDKYPSVPLRGSPLETVFVAIHLQRMEANLLATRSLVRGQFALLAKSPEAAKEAFDAFQLYADTMFPFLEKAARTTTTDQVRLAEHVKYPIEINVQALRHERAQQARSKAFRKFQVGRKSR